MNGALPQNQFQNLSHSPESIRESVIFHCVQRGIGRNHSSVHHGYSCIGNDARSNEKPYSAMRAAPGGFHRLGLL
jgi:hypothetical protein